MINFKVLKDGIYISKAKAIVIGDLHLGTEEALKLQQGINLPKIQLPEMKKEIAKMQKQCNAEKIILLGDLKHDFSRLTRQELQELDELIAFLSRELKLKVIIIKGNHDNFIESMKAKQYAELHYQYIDEKILFMHGHEMPPEKLKGKYNAVVIGHEHSAIALKDEIGSRHKFKAVIAGKWKDNDLILVPAISMFAGGTAINEVPKQKLLSPILKHCNLGEFEAWAISEDNVKKFPKLKYLV